MPNVIFSDPDDYVETVIGKARRELISTNVKDKSGNIDEEANRAATFDNITEEADRLSEMVVRQSSSAALTKTCEKLLHEARQKIRPEDYKVDDALDRVEDVKRYLIRAYKSRKLRPKLFWRIFGLNLVYFAAFAAVIIWKSLLPLTSATPIGMGAGVLSCAIWGGIGGVVDALIALNSHFADQDFDEQYAHWYYLHPLIGMSLGAIVYLVLQAGLATISNSSTASEAGATTVQVGITAFSIAVAFLSGFKQNDAVKFLGRVVKSVFQKEDSEDEEPS